MMKYPESFPEISLYKLLIPNSEKGYPAEGELEEEEWKRWWGRRKRQRQKRDDEEQKREWRRRRRG